MLKDNVKGNAWGCRIWTLSQKDPPLPLPGFNWGQFQRSVELKKGPSDKSHPQLQQFLLGASIERVGVDTVGLLLVTNRGSRCVLTAMNFFHKVARGLCAH